MRPTDRELHDFLHEVFLHASRLFPCTKNSYSRPILVHSSLSSFPKEWRKPKKVLSALYTHCKKYSLTLVMCAHQDYLSYKKEIRSSSIPCLSMGILSETFRKQLFTKRSHHPLYSFCARGPSASRLLKNHSITNSLGFDSPLGKLLDEDALILMLGTDWKTCSILHLAEYAYEEQQNQRGEMMECVTNVCFVKRKLHRWSDLQFRTDVFPSIGQAFLAEKKDLYFKGWIDASRKTEFTCFRARDLVSFSIDRYASFR